MEISVEKLGELQPEDCVICDIRGERDRAYGFIPGSVGISAEELLAFPPGDGKKLIIYCARGIVSVDLADELCDRGLEAYSLEGGYIAWLRAEMRRRNDEELRERVEQSIRKKFRVSLMSKFIKALKTYQLVNEGDRVAVCISGGKDSMLMAKLMQELHRHSDVPFELVFLVMDPGYNAINRQRIESNAALLHIPITVFETNIFEVANSTDKSPCYLCARMRRGHLYSKAKELGCNKIALGHHFNDVIETTVMGMFYGSQLQAMLPKLHSDNFEGMELIRPMYCIHEENIIAWRQYNQLEFIQCACRFTENCTICDNGGGGSKRQEIKTLLRRLKRDNPNIEKSIFNSIHTVALDTFPGYKTKGEVHSFLEHYDQ